MRVTHLRSYVQVMGEPRFQIRFSEGLSSCFPPGKRWMLVCCLDGGSATSALAATERGSAMAHITGRHVDRLRQLRCCVLRSTASAEAPLDPCWAPRLSTVELCFLFPITMYNLFQCFCVHSISNLFSY